MFYANLGEIPQMLFDGNAYIVLEEGDRIQITTQSASTFSFIATLTINFLL